ncbi:MAG: ABC transporter ATP-binding protein [Thalassotalea sp.]
MSCQALSWQIDNKLILADINFEIVKGSFTGLLGPNGAGKSSLLRCLYRYVKPVTGKVLFVDENIWQISATQYAQKVAVVLQDSPSQFNLSVFDVVALGLVPHQSLFGGSSNKQGKLAVEQALTQVGLYAKAKQAFENLSGGEKQRALIARAIVQKPELLIMDEPTSHLDVKYQIQIMELAKSLGITVIASFHDLNLASAMSDQLLVLADGKLVAQGSPEQIMTSELLSDVFGVCADVTPHPQTEHHNIPHITYYYGYQQQEKANRQCVNRGNDQQSGDSERQT